MHLEEKKIYLVLSPHINYYHSYRGDMNGPSGFGLDIAFMEKILDQLDAIEDRGLCGGITRITWDYADTFWSIQLQREYQQHILDRVIERCKKGKDEVLIGAWSNVAQAILDTEEFQQQHKWYLENSMGIGLNQLFSGRVAPYARTQETMFTQGMIEQYNRLGVDGLCLYYSTIPFDATRPFLNPRLDWNQQFGLVKFKSSVSNASVLMIPMYGFGDVFDNLSIKSWLKKIRKKQESGEISEHALIFLNFDMDEDTWVGIKLPKLIQWFPNTRGLFELAEAVDQYEFVEFANLLDVIPKLKVYGEIILRQDVADGNYNGFYNWALKFNNTKFWTLGQWARWLKCISDTLLSMNLNLSKDLTLEVNKYIRNTDDSAESYIKNKLLFSSTTNFGMSMPFLHSHRLKTTTVYGLRAFNAAEKAVNLTLKEITNTLFENSNLNDYQICIIPITNRGISDREKISVKSSILIKTEIPLNLMEIIKKNNEILKLRSGISDKNLRYSIYEDESKTKLNIEAVLPASLFKKKGVFTANILTEMPNDANISNNGVLEATTKEIKNKFINLKFNENGKIVSFKKDNKEFGCPKFLESAVVFGKLGKEKRFSSDKDKIIVMRDGRDGFSASVKIISKFEIIDNYFVNSEKIFTLYSEIPGLFVDIKMTVPEIKGEIDSLDGDSSVTQQYDTRWQEIMPCEIRPNLIGNRIPLRIWKKNFLGYISYFDLNMREVDSKNANIDCMVANISDGWMALSNKTDGMLIGFNSLKAANFAFTPIKIRNKGFKDGHKKGQQIRINPFGTYFGKILHYWTDGTGHAQKFVTTQSSTFRSSAPTFSGKTISFDIVIIPYSGDEPPDSVKSFADHFSLPPLILMSKGGQEKIFNNYSRYRKMAESFLDEFEVREIFNLSYMEWVKKVNIEPDIFEKKPFMPKMGIKTLLTFLIDGIRGK